MMQTLIQTSLRRTSYWSWIFLLLLSACQSPDQPSKEQIESAKTAVTEIRTTLYAPQDAQLLAEELHYGTNPKNYPGCVRGFIFLAYQSPRSFEQILADYREGLTEAGWESSPDYSHDQTGTDFFEKGPQVFLVIANGPTREDLFVVPTPTAVAGQVLTVYYLELSYDDPSRHQCSEG